MRYDLIIKAFDVKKGEYVKVTIAEKCYFDRITQIALYNGFNPETPQPEIEFFYNVLDSNGQIVRSDILLKNRIKYVV